MSLFTEASAHHHRGVSCWRFCWRTDENSRGCWASDMNTWLCEELQDDNPVRGEICPHCWVLYEVWVNKHGPYATRELAEEGLKRYAKWLDEGNVF